MTTSLLSTPRVEGGSSHPGRAYADEHLRHQTFLEYIGSDWYFFKTEAVMQALSDEDRARLHQTVADEFMAETDAMRQACDERQESLLKSAFLKDRTVVDGAPPPHWLELLPVGTDNTPTEVQDADQAHATTDEQFRAELFQSAQMQVSLGSLGGEHTNEVL